MQHGEFFAHQLEELHRIQFAFAARLALGVERAAQEVGVVHARDLDRILERQKNAERGAFLGLQCQQILSLERHRTFADLVTIAAGDDVAERGFAGAVRTHDGVDFAGLHVQREPFEDGFAGDTGVEVVDLQHVGSSAPCGDWCKGRLRRTQVQAPSHAKVRRDPPVPAMS